MPACGPVYSSQYKERQAARRLRLSGFGAVAIGLVLTWFFVAEGRERQRQRQRLLAEQQVNEAAKRSGSRRLAPARRPSAVTRRPSARRWS